MKNPAETRSKSINHDVKFRLSEIVLIFDLDYLIRHHLAKDDRSHNWVEHTQSYLGDAICNGGSLEWAYQGEFDGLIRTWNAENDVWRTATSWVKTNEIQCSQSLQWTHQ